MVNGDEAHFNGWGPIKNKLRRKSVKCKDPSLARLSRTSGEKLAVLSSHTL